MRRRAPCILAAMVAALGVAHACSSSGPGSSADPSTADGASDAQPTDARAGDAFIDGALGDAGADARALSVRILKPASDASYKNGDPIPLEAVAANKLGQPIVDPIHLVWTTELSPEPIGQGASSSFTLDGAEAGVYAIRVRVSDEDDASASDQVLIRVP